MRRARMRARGVSIEGWIVDGAMAHSPAGTITIGADGLQVTPAKRVLTIPLAVLAALQSWHANELQRSALEVEDQNARDRAAAGDDCEACRVAVIRCPAHMVRT